MLFLIFAVLMIFVGLVVSMVSCLYMVQRIVQTHLHILNKRLLAREYVVLDLSLPENSRAATDVPLSMAIGTRDTPEPSAPPLPNTRHQLARMLSKELDAV
jgi:hypothetical protein